MVDEQLINVRFFCRLRFISIKDISPCRDLNNFLTMAKFNVHGIWQKQAGFLALTPKLKPTE